MSWAGCGAGRATPRRSVAGSGRPRERCTETPAARAADQRVSGRRGVHDRTAATAVVRSHHPRPTRHTPGPWPTLRPSSSHDAPSPPAQHGPPSLGQRHRHRQRQWQRRRRNLRPRATHAEPTANPRLRSPGRRDTVTPYHPTGSPTPTPYRRRCVIPAQSGYRWGMVTLAPQVRAPWEARGQDLAGQGNVGVPGGEWREHRPLR